MNNAFGKYALLTHFVNENDLYKDLYDYLYDNLQNENVYTLMWDLDNALTINANE
jgi:predicted HAD superfamily phosphohydrolase YqeG